MSVFTEEFGHVLNFVETSSYLEPWMMADFLTTIPLITYYHNTYYHVAVKVSKRGWGSLVKKTERTDEFTDGIHKIEYKLDDLRDYPREKFRKKFIIQVKKDLDGLRSSKKNSLIQFGISPTKAGVFFDYITGKKDGNGKRIVATKPHPYALETEKNQCCYSLGCINPATQDLLSFHGDHASPDSVGGETLQPMCAIHNRIKTNNLIFDNFTMKQLVD